MKSWNYSFILFFSWCISVISEPLFDKIFWISSIIYILLLSYRIIIPRFHILFIFSINLFINYPIIIYFFFFLFIIRINILQKFHMLLVRSVNPKSRIYYLLLIIVYYYNIIIFYYYFIALL
jgi:hypothetical protein